MSSNPPNPRPRRSGRGSGGGGGGSEGGGGRGGGGAAAPTDNGKRTNKRKNQALVSSPHGASPAPISGGVAAALTGQGSTGGNHHNQYNYHPHHYHHHGNRNPLRGGPGILWTCETGLERKCRHQATDILQHYYGNSSRPQLDHIGDAPAADGREGLASSLSPPRAPAKLTLEQELAALKEEGRNRHRHNNSNHANRSFPFSVYETKCKGIVLMLFTSPDATLWSSSSSSSSTPGAPDAAGAVGADNPERDDDDPDAKPPSKRRRVDSTSPASANSNEEKPVKPSEANLNEGKVQAPHWDPLETVLAVIKDARDAMRLEVALARGGDAGLPASALRPTSMGVVPSSRFVTRIIPLQITCYASVDDIQAAFKTLLQRFLSTTEPPRAVSSESTASAASTSGHSTPDTTTSKTTTTTTTTTTYMVQSKRRHCDNLRSKDVIDGVGALVPSNWKVDLRNPDLVVWVEICTNLAGLSIVPSVSLREAFQFNLLQARTASVAAE